MQVETIFMNEAGVLAPIEWELPQLASSRAQVYGVLSTVYGGLPGEQMVRLLSSWSVSEMVSRESLPVKMRRGLRRINTWMGERGPEPSETATLDAEFTRLFRGLGRTKSPPPPYESVYLDGGLLYGPSTQRVADTYRRHQVTGRDNEPPDYIALELDFMRLLCKKEALAWQADGDGVRELITEEKDFLREHLSRWVPVFCEAVRRFDTTSFYAGLADITEGWICCDRRVVSGLVRLYG